MKNLKQKLIIEQVDAKLNIYKPLLKISVPDKGWIHSIRKVYKMSFRQFGDLLNITPPSAEAIEKRERDKSITLKSLEQAGKVLNMKLVYGFIPIDGSIEKSIENQAQKIATHIVMTTSATMVLEGQEISKKRLGKSIKEKTTQLVNEMPRYLWD